MTNLKYLIPIILLLFITMPKAQSLGATSDSDASKKAEFVRIQEEIVEGNYAIIIGIDNYNYIRPQLSSCEKDAIGIRDRLIEFGWNPDHIYLFLDRDDSALGARVANRSALIRITNKLSNPSLYEKGGTLFFFFSGHGGSVEEEYYLYTVDGLNSSEREITDTNLDFMKIFGKFFMSNFERRVFVIDACRSVVGKAGLGGSYEAISPDAMGNIKGTLLITSSEREKPSFDLYNNGYSFFTYYFLRGLSELGADDGVIYVESAFDFAEEQMKAYSESPEAAHYQVPEMMGSAEERIPLAVVGGWESPRPTPLFYTWGGIDRESASSVAIDVGVNVYIAGSFEGTTDLDPGPGKLNRTSLGSSDAYLLKLDSEGTLQWAKTWGGTHSTYALAVATDAGGNVYIAGYFRSTADLDPGSGTLYRTSLGDQDAYFIKLDSDGNLIR